MRTVGKMFLAMLAMTLAMPVFSSQAAFTTITGSVAVPQPYGAAGPESVKYVANNCVAAQETRNGTTHAVVHVKSFANKTLKITPTTVQADIPVDLISGQIRVGWFKDCSPTTWFGRTYEYAAATTAKPAIIKITNHVALLIVNTRGVNQNYKIECILNC